MTEHADSETRTTTARRRFQDVWPQIQARLISLRQAGRWTEALVLCTEAATLWPDRPEPFFHAARIHLNQDRCDAAADALEEAFVNGLSSTSHLRTRARIHDRSGNEPGFVADAETLHASGEPVPAASLRRVAEYHRDAGDLDRAAGFADIALATKPGLGLARLKTDIAFERAGFRDLDRVTETLVTAPDAVPEIAVAILHLHRQVGGMSGTVARLSAFAAERWPDSTVPAWLRSVIEGGGTDGPIAPLPAGASYQDHRARTGEVFERATRKRASIPASLIGTFSDQTAGHPLRRPPVADDPDRDVIVSPRGDNGRVAIVFTGLADVAMVPLEVTDTFFAILGTTVIYLKDFHRLLYCNGIKSLAGDFSASVAALDALTRSLGDFDHLTVMGTSAGGQGALNYGLDLGAERILCFSPPTNTTADFMENAGDTRAKTVVRRLNLLAPAPLLDVRSRFAACPPRGPVDIVFGAENRIDRAHAENLRGLPNVHLHPITGLEAHGSILETIARDALTDVLRGDMSGLGRPPRAQIASGA